MTNKQARSAKVYAVNIEPGSFLFRHILLCKWDMFKEENEPIQAVIHNAGDQSLVSYPREKKSVERANILWERK